MDINQTSSYREHDKNVSGFVRSMCTTQKKIVSNIFICICSGKYGKNVQRQISKGCAFNLTNILPKIEIISHCESH